MRTRTVESFRTIFVLAILFGIVPSTVSAACQACLAGLSLPPTVTTTVTGSGTSSYLVVTTSGVPAGYDIGNQTYPGWCLEDLLNAAPGVVSDFSTYGTLQGKYATIPWDKINWLINNKSRYLYNQYGAEDPLLLQKAIWYLLGYTYQVSSKDTVPLQALQDAATYGVGFVPGPGQVVAVLFDSATHQDTIIEVPVPRFGSIGDTVWLDSNHNGIQDSGENGINGVTILLKNAAGATIATATTTTVGGLDGQYLFTDLPKGTYFVEVLGTSTPLSGLLATTALVGSNKAIDSNDSSTPVILPDDHSEDRTIDFGYQTSCSGQIGDFVWNDYNRNGIQDPGEPGIANVTVNLYDIGLVLRQTTTTNALGLYSFGGVCGGTYKVEVATATLPTGFTPTPSTTSGNPATDSNGSPAWVTLPQDNSVDSSIDFGYLQPCTGSIGNFVWHDLNRNGIQDAGESGIDGVTVLLKSGDNVVNTATTAGGGFYQFSGVCAGTYTVEYAGVPATFSPTTPSAPGSNAGNDSNGPPATVVLPAPDSQDQTIDFGFLGTCSGVIGDLVWNDINRNGIQDANEPGWPGVTVNLRRASDNTILATAFTDANGKYLFSGRCTGDYMVEVIPPAGFAASPTGQGSPDLDSNPNAATVKLTNDLVSDLTIDFGFNAGSIGDTVWHDLNGNGIQDAGEPGLPGWTVQIFGGSLPTGYLTSQTTGATGLYGFFNLPAGDYRVCVTPPAGWTETYDLDGLATPNCAVRTIAAGQDALDVDFGYVQLPSSTCVTINALQNVAITPVTMVGSGGTGAPYTFTATGLPDGLTMSPGGTISGTPTVSGTFNYTITVQDKDKNTGTTNCSVNVTPSVKADCVLIDAIQNVAITPVTMVGSGGTGAPYTFTATGLPNGLTISPGGTISGTPTVTGTFNYTITIQDKDKNTGTTNCSVTVYAPPTATCLVINAVRDVPFSAGPMSGSGGTAGPYRFAKFSGPSWLNVSESGIVSGTPDATGVFNYTVTVTDKDGHTGKKECSVSVTAPLTPTCGAISSTTGVIGVLYSASVSATGGSGGYVFSNPVGLPAGFSMNAAGLVTGTPTAAGSTSFTFTVKDGDGHTATGGNCPIVVTGTPTFQKTANPGAAQPFQPVNFTYTITNPTNTNVTIPLVVDDAGTPSFTGDDVVLGTNVPIPAFGTWSITKALIPAVKECATINSVPNASAGTLTAQILPSGDVKIVFRQTTAIVDNTYGANAVGWKNGHRFSDLLNSDVAQFQLYDNKGTKVLDFKFDYITSAAKTIYPSGYGTLGVSGGEGGMLTGNAAWILGVLAPATLSDGTVVRSTTTITTDLNQSTAYYGYTANSPAPSDPNYPNWDAVDGYTIYISKAAFGANSFGKVQVPLVHNSPPKIGTGAVYPTPCGAYYSTNTATAGLLSASATVALGSAAAPAPDISITKTASATQVTPGTPVTYTYVVTNTGQYTLTNVAAVDDNATPEISSDDITVGTVASLAPGASATFTRQIVPVVTPDSPVTMCQNVSGKNTAVGSMVVTQLPPNTLLPNGNTTGPAGATQVVYLQSTSVVDNNYGTSATASTGWSNGHKFSDLTGSDKAEFRFTDDHGVAVLDIGMDYLHAVATARYYTPSGGSGLFTYPSGYGTAGTTGDGSVFVGNVASNLLYFSTTITENLNQSLAYYGLTTNSPSPSSPLFGNWNLVDGYTVVINNAVFGTAGFGAVTVPLIHNSPSKLSVNALSPTPCGADSTNTVFASGYYGTTLVQADATATVSIVKRPFAGNFITVSQSQWGASPDSGNPAAMLVTNWTALYGAAGAKIGGGKYITILNADSVADFLPQGGTAGKLLNNYSLDGITDPVTTEAGVLAGQVMALKLNVDFSTKGYFPTGFGNVKPYASGPFAGKTVTQILTTANAVLGGGSLPSGVTYSSLSDMIDFINNMYPM